LIQTRIQPVSNKTRENFLSLAVRQIAVRDEITDPRPGLTGARKRLIDRQKRIRFFSGLIGPDHSAELSDALSKVSVHRLHFI
jgi:hypothetical protein